MMNNRIHNFLRSHFSFVADEQLHVIGQGGKSHIPRSLAASGRHDPISGAERIGVLTNTDCTFLVRVLQNKTAEQYDLYFLAEADQTLTGSVLFQDRSFQAYLIPNSQKVSIPFSHGLNPMEVFLSVAKPKKSGVWNQRSPGAEHRYELTLDRSTCLHLQTKQRGSQQEFVVTIDIESTTGPDLTKLAWVQDQWNRIVPITRNRVQLTVPTDVSEQACIFLYQ